MKKLFVLVLAVALMMAIGLALTHAEEPAEYDLTVYVKNTADWEIINIFAWDNYDGAATNMKWEETPMTDLGNGWKAFALKAYNKDFFLCFQNGGSSWTNDVPVLAGTTEVYLELKAEIKADRQVCQYTEDRFNWEDGTTLTVTMKNDANWEIINIFAWDNYNGEATNMKWEETPMADAGEGYKTYSLTTYGKDFFLCFQNGGSSWTNDVPVMPGSFAITLVLKDEVKADRQVCQYLLAEETPEEAAPAEEPVQAEEPAEEDRGEATSLTVYMKNDAGWEVVNIFAWDDYDGKATDMKWEETPMVLQENGWYSYTMNTWKEFYLCFQNGGPVWSNDVPVEAGATEVYLVMKDQIKGDRQVCQYTEERP